MFTSTVSTPALLTQRSQTCTCTCDERGPQLIGDGLRRRRLLLAGYALPPAAERVGCGGLGLLDLCLLGLELGLRRLELDTQLAGLRVGVIDARALLRWYGMCDE